VLKMAELPEHVHGLKTQLKTSQSALTKVLEELASLKVQTSRGRKEKDALMDRDTVAHTEAIQDMEKQHDQEKQEFCMQHIQLRNRLCGKLMAQQNAILNKAFTAIGLGANVFLGSAVSEDQSERSKRSESDEREKNEKKNRKSTKLLKKLEKKRVTATPLVVPLDTLQMLVEGLGDLGVLASESRGLPNCIALNRVEEGKLDQEYPELQAKLEDLARRCEHIRGNGLDAVNAEELESIEQLHITGGQQISLAKERLQSKELERLQAETESIQDRAKCCVCLTNPIETLIMPCSHFCVCDECASTLEDCPICRGSIKNRLKVAMERPSGPTAGMKAAAGPESENDIMSNLDQRVL